MEDLEEQCVCIKLCEIRKTFTETFQMLKQAYGEPFVRLEYISLEK
jgi:hypothetical protein